MRREHVVRLGLKWRYVDDIAAIDIRRTGAGQYRIQQGSCIAGWRVCNNQKPLCLRGPCHETMVGGSASVVNRLLVSRVREQLIDELTNGG